MTSLCFTNNASRRCTTTDRFASVCMSIDLVPQFNNLFQEELDV